MEKTYEVVQLQIWQDLYIYYMYLNFSHTLSLYHRHAHTSDLNLFYNLITFILIHAPPKAFAQV